MIFALLKKYAEKPSVIIPSVILGILCGHFFPQFSTFYTGASHLYLSSLEMCVLPVMATAIISSLGNLIHENKTVFYLQRMFIVFAGSLFLAACVGTLMTLLVQPGRHLSAAAMNGIGQAILNGQNTVGTMESVTRATGLWGFLSNLVPNNIFSAMAGGQSLAVLFVSVLVGIAIGLQRTVDAKNTLNVVHSLYLAFITIIQWVMVGLPLGLFFLFANYISTSGGSILSALSMLILMIIAAGLAMMVLFVFIIRYRTGHSILKVIVMLRQPLAMAFFTSSSLATMPTTLNALQQNFKLNPDVTSLVVPLGTSFNQQASVLRYTCVALFILQMYGLHLHLDQVPFLLLTAILAGIAGGGMPGLAAISMCTFVLSALGLPASVGLILLAVIEPIIDPVTTMVNVFGNCMAVTLVDKTPRKLVE